MVDYFRFTDTSFALTMTADRRFIKITSFTLKWIERWRSVTSFGVDAGKLSSNLHLAEFNL